jgi:anaerobic selenocysteine-containing dehydrogenase
MSKKDLNILNYIIAVINENNKKPFKLNQNTFIFLIDKFKYKKIDYEFIKEQTQGYYIIITYFNKYKIEMELDPDNKIKLLAILKKDF